MNSFKMKVFSFINFRDTTHLDESRTHHICLGLTIVYKQYTSGTHDFLVRTHQNFILQ